MDSLNLRMAQKVAFVHVSAVSHSGVGALHEGQKVEYDFVRLDECKAQS